MAEFDPIRAQREVTNGIAETHAVVRQLLRNAERKLGEAEIERNAHAKVEALLREHLNTEREKLTKLIWAAENK